MENAGASSGDAPVIVLRDAAQFEKRNLKQCVAECRASLDARGVDVPKFRKLSAELNARMDAYGHNVKAYLTGVRAAGWDAPRKRAVVRWLEEELHTVNTEVRSAEAQLYQTAKTRCARAPVQLGVLEEIHRLNELNRQTALLANTAELLLKVVDESEGKGQRLEHELHRAANSLDVGGAQLRNAVAAAKSGLREKLTRNLLVANAALFALNVFAWRFRRG